MAGRTLCLLLLTLAAWCQPKGNGVIEGTVRLHGSGDPVRKAVVMVVWQGTPRAWATVQTDASGRFRVDSLPPGQYTIQAHKEGVGQGNWGANESAISNRLLELAESEHRADLAIPLVRSASISGVVTDEDGEPLPHIQVQLLREGYPRGTRELVPRGSARTNDRGEFRFSTVEPGKVYISAQNQLPFNMLTAQGQRAQLYPVHYYPGTGDWRRATPLAVRSGAEIRGIDIRLVTVPGAVISGRISGLPTTERSSPAGQATVTIHPDGDWQLPMGRSAVVLPDHTFRIDSLSPGRYKIAAHTFDHSLWASQYLDVKENIADIDLHLLPPASISGKLTIEGSSAVPIHQMTVRLTMGRNGGRSWPAMTATPKPDGSFVFPQVPPGVWDIGVQPIPRGGYLKSMHLGDQDVLTEEMEIGMSPPPALNLVVSSQGAKVSGVLAGEAGKTMQAMILLAPVGKFQHVISFYAMAQSGEGGRFELIGLTPGKYRVFAFGAAGSPVDPRNPEILARLSEYAETVELSEGSAETVSPRVISAERFQEALQ